MAKHGKKYMEARKKVDPDKKYDLAEALAIAVNHPDRAAALRVVLPLLDMPPELALETVGIGRLGIRLPGTDAACLADLVVDGRLTEIR